MKNAVALLDSVIQKELVLQDRNIVFDRNYCIESRSLHGPLCVCTMQDIEPEINIYSMAILDGDEHTSYIKLYETLEYLKNLDIKIINLSLSTLNDNAKNSLEKICNVLAEQGKIIVASVDNESGVGYPALFKNVIGVKGLRTMLQNEFWYNKDYMVQCTCDMSPLLMPINNKFIVFSGTSKSAAIMSAYIFSIIKKMGNIGYKELEELLQKNATRTEWDIKKRYLDSNSIPDFLNNGYNVNYETVVTVLDILSEVLESNITIKSINKNDNLLIHGMDCAKGCRFLKLLEISLGIKINKPVQYYRLLNIRTILSMVKEIKK